MSAPLGIKTKDIAISGYAICTYPFDILSKSPLLYSDWNKISKDKKQNDDNKETADFFFFLPIISSVDEAVKAFPIFTKYMELYIKLQEKTVPPKTFADFAIQLFVCDFMNNLLFL
jgi:hypothetical protein